MSDKPIPLHPLDPLMSSTAAGHADPKKSNWNIHAGPITLPSGGETKIDRAAYNALLIQRSKIEQLDQTKSHAIGYRDYPKPSEQMLRDNEELIEQTMRLLNAFAARSIAGASLTVKVSAEEMAQETGITAARCVAIIDAMVRDKMLAPTGDPDTYLLTPRKPKPLIDQLHEATFTDQVGMQWVEDKFALRNILRKAHCFTIDTHTSGLISDFSLAIANDLDAARRLSMPPFPTTWFEIDNRARLDRLKERGIPLTVTAQRDDVIPRVGWLITTTGPDEYCATYVCHLDQGILIPPLSFRWVTGVGSHVGDVRGQQQMERLVFGVTPTNVSPNDAWLFPATFQRQLSLSDGDRSTAWIKQQELNMMIELSGELRHIFGLLVALGAGQLGATTSMAPQARPEGPPVVMKGKTLLPIEHKVLTINLAKRVTVEKVAARAITGMKKKEHDVRGHFRTLRNADGTVKKRVPVKSHKRGDIRLGRVEKTYRVQTEPHKEPT